MGYEGSILVLAHVGDQLCWGLLQSRDSRGVDVLTSDGERLRWHARRILLDIASEGHWGADNLAQLEEATVRAGDAVDLSELWGLVSSENRGFTIQELCGMAFGDASPQYMGAMAAALHADRIYFKAESKGRFKPRSESLVQMTLEQQRAENERRRRVLDAAQAVQARIAGQDYDRDAFMRGVAMLKEAAISDEWPRDHKLLMETIGMVDPDPAIDAFRVLQQLGVFHEDENLLLYKYRLDQPFPEDVVQEANVLTVRSQDSHAGERLCPGLHVIAVDDPWTTEVDDALAMEVLGDDLFRVHVLIADPGAVVPVDSQVAMEAQGRGATLYLPNYKRLMFPAVISEQACTLSTDRDVYAMDFQCDLAGNGTVRGFSIKTGTVRLTQRLTYEQVESILAGDTDSEWTILYELARVLRTQRLQQGASIFDTDNVTVRVQDGRPVIYRYYTGSPARVLVSEFMVLVGGLAGEFCKLHQVPAIYRQCGPPVDVERLSGIPEDSMEYRYRLLQRMPRSRLTVHPERHYGLGIDAYTQVTSPLRRYQDFVMHHQIKAFLSGKNGMWSEQDLLRTFGDLESVQSIYSRVTRAATRYFLLKYLLVQGKMELQAWVVLHERGKTLLSLKDTGLSTWVKGTVGTRDEAITVRVDELDPRRDILKVSA